MPAAPGAVRPQNKAIYKMLGHLESASVLMRILLSLLALLAVVVFEQNTFDCKVAGVQLVREDAK
jgi:hypothetical protein